LQRAAEVAPAAADALISVAFAVTYAIPQNKTKPLMCGCSRGGGGGGFSTARHIAAQQLALRAANSRSSGPSSVSVRSVKPATVAVPKAASAVPKAAASAAPKAAVLPKTASAAPKTAPQFTKYAPPLARMTVAKSASASASATASATKKLAPRFLGLPGPMQPRRR
jgi:hypothetical protein